MKHIEGTDKFGEFSYQLSEPEGKNFAKDFMPQLTPKEMLELGVFGGEYFADTPSDLPKSWWAKAKLSTAYNKDLNYFGVKASQPRQVWLEKGWIREEYDPRGWFQWYCRYYMGRRIPEYDAWQIGRWRNIRRHVAQLQKACPIGELNCRPVQRQALLHWAYDSRTL